MCAVGTAAPVTATRLVGRFCSSHDCQLPAETSASLQPGSTTVPGFQPGLRLLEMLARDPDEGITSRFPQDPSFLYIPEPPSSASHVT